MGDRALENRIRKIKELEAQKKEIEAQINSLKDEIRADMTAKQLEEYRTKHFVIRFKEVISRCFDGKAFSSAYPDLYDSYRVVQSSKRLTIS